MRKILRIQFHHSTPDKLGYNERWQKRNDFFFGKHFEHGRMATKESLAQFSKDIETPNSITSQRTFLFLVLFFDMNEIGIYSPPSNEKFSSRQMRRAKTHQPRTWRAIHPWNCKPKMMITTYCFELNLHRLCKHKTAKPQSELSLRKCAISWSFPRSTLCLSRLFYTANGIFHSIFKMYWWHTLKRHFRNKAIREAGTRR